MNAVAVSNIAWPAESDDEVAPLLRAAGVTCIEVAPSRIFGDVGTARHHDAAARAKLWLDRGLPVASMQALLFGRPDLVLFTDQKGTDAFVTYLSHVISLAGALGCGPLVFGSPRNRQKGARGFAEAAALAVPVFRALGDVCATQGTVLCLEANAEAYGCDFMTDLAEAAAVVRAVAHPSVGLVADTGNMIMAGETPSALAPVADLVRHVHVSAPRLGPVQDHAPFVRDVWGRLRDAGYQGHVTLEMLPTGEGQAALGAMAENAAFLVDLVRAG